MRTALWSAVAAMAMAAAPVTAELQRVELDLAGDQVELLLGAAAAAGVLTAETAEGSAYNELLHTTPRVALVPGGRYAVEIDYRFETAGATSSPYVLFRGREAGTTADTGLVHLDPAGAHARYEAHLALRDDYYLIIGVERGGRIEVSRVVIQQLPGGTTVVHPAEDLAPLANPDKGWVLHFYDNSVDAYGQRIRPGERLDFPGLSMVYFRLAWGYLEPEEGRFDWSRIDPWYRQFVDQGLKVGFRITCFESGGIPYATPRWVEDAGARFFAFADPDSPQRQPGWDDPVFLSKLDAFLAAFAARYDADPNVAWIDIGSLGVWGEGHAGWSSTGPIALAAYQKHIDLHYKHFRNTRLVVNDDFGYDAVRYACGLGAALRDDSICVDAERPYFHQDMADWFWRNRPVIVETEHYGPSVQRGAWDSATVERSIEEYHASWVSIHHWPDEFLAQERGLVERLANRMGYWLFVPEARMPAALGPGVPFTVSVRWENRGVAPLYRNYAVALGLKDAAGRVVWSGADMRWDLRSLGPAEGLETTHSHPFPHGLAPGTYTLCLGLSPRDEPAVPVVALAVAGRDSDRWHPLGTIDVLP